MRRIDAHQHYWHYLPQHYPWITPQMAVLQQDFGRAELEPLLQQQGFDAALVIQTRHSEQETEQLLAMVRPQGTVCGVVGWLDITAADLAERLAACGPHLRGLRHLVQDEADPAAWLARQDVARGIRVLQHQGYSYDLLVTHRHLDAATQFATRHDDHWLVLDHFGKPDIASGARHWARQIRELAALPHVVCKLSGLITEAAAGQWQEQQLRPFFDVALEAFGPQRLMFGSDWPVCLLAGEYHQVYQLCEQAIVSLSPSQQAAIWGGTACQIYGLTESTHGFISEQ